MLISQKKTGKIDRQAGCHGSKQRNSVNDQLQASTLTATQPFSVSSRNAPLHEEHCVTTLKTAV